MNVARFKKLGDFGKRLHCIDGQSRDQADQEKASGQMALAFSSALTKWSFGIHEANR